MKKRKTKNKSQKSGKSPEINKNMTFIKIMQKYPKAAKILMKRGMHCVGCGMAGYETLEQGAVMHGLDADKLVNEINKKIKKTMGHRTLKGAVCNN